MALDALTQPQSAHVKLPHIFEWPFPDSPLRAAVIPAACAPFSAKLSPSTHISMNMLGYRHSEQPSSLAITF